MAENTHANIVIKPLSARILIVVKCAYKTAGKKIILNSVKLRKNAAMFNSEARPDAFLPKKSLIQRKMLLTSHSMTDCEMAGKCIPPSRHKM